MDPTLDQYRVNIGGLERCYPIVPLSDEALGVYFFMPGDVELIEHCGRLIADKIGASCNYIMVPEVGGIPLAHAISRRLGLDYLVVRKSVKPYMHDPVVEQVKSITTPDIQRLVIDGRDIMKVKGKKIALVDDVISTLGTIRGLFELGKKCSADVAFIATIFLEGDTTSSQVEAEFGCPLISLGHLPLIPRVQG